MNRIVKISPVFQLGVKIGQTGGTQTLSININLQTEAILYQLGGLNKRWDTPVNKHLQTCNQNAVMVQY